MHSVEGTAVTLCAQQMHNPLALATFLVTNCDAGGR